MWSHRPACLPYSISFHWSTPLRRPPQCRCQTHSPKADKCWTRIWQGSSHLGTDVRSTSTDKTGQNPIYCQGSSAVSLSNLFNGVLWNIGFSLLGSCLSRFRLHRACPHCSWVRFPPHLPRTQLRQRSEPWLEMRLSFALAISKLMPQSKEWLILASLSLCIRCFNEICEKVKHPSLYTNLESHGRSRSQHCNQGNG